MCSQHIDKKCTKCGWGLPLMTAKRANRPSPTLASASSSAPAQRSGPAAKKIRTTQGPVPATSAFGHHPDSTQNLQIAPLDPFPVCNAAPAPMIKSWKQIYAERSVVARNWRKPCFKSMNLLGHTDAVMAMYYCEAKSLLITGSSDNTLRAWNTTSGVCLAILKGHTGCIRGVQFDDSKIISCSMDKTIRIWNLKTWECVRVIEDHTIKKWDFYTGEVVNTMFGHTEGVWGVQADTIRIVSASKDRNLKVWDLESGQCIYTISSHQSPVHTVWLSDTKLISGDSDGIITVRDFLSASC
ncbi:hypothetical protein HDU91_005645 [Kappamyces sp. JEL0680]|nr:hypothetical protein HDU91_005645 [Kappamyces sp. JEL0680]